MLTIALKAVLFLFILLDVLDFLFNLGKNFNQFVWIGWNQDRDTVVLIFCGGTNTSRDEVVQCHIVEGNICSFNFSWAIWLILQAREHLCQQVHFLDAPVP
eukprot:9010763-Ditylum_brightwellii.AAC.1